MNHRLMKRGVYGDESVRARERKRGKAASSPKTHGREGGSVLNGSDSTGRSEGKEGEAEEGPPCGTSR